MFGTRPKYEHTTTENDMKITMAHACIVWFHMMTTGCLKIGHSKAHCLSSQLQNHNMLAHFTPQNRNILTCAMANQGIRGMIIHPTIDQQFILAIVPPNVTISECWALTCNMFGLSIPHCLFPFDLHLNHNELMAVNNPSPRDASIMATFTMLMKWLK